MRAVDSQKNEAAQSAVLRAPQTLHSVELQKVFQLCGFFCGRTFVPTRAKTRRIVADVKVKLVVAVDGGVRPFDLRQEFVDGEIFAARAVSCGHIAQQNRVIHRAHERPVLQNGARVSGIVGQMQIAHDDDLQRVGVHVHRSRRNHGAQSLRFGVR